MDPTPKQSLHGEWLQRRDALLAARGGSNVVAVSALQEGVTPKRIAAAFQQRYPRAWAGFADAVGFHLAQEGVETLRDLLAGIRLTEETGELFVDPGQVKHMMYHFYNYSLILELAQRVDSDFADYLDQIDEALQEGSLEEARAALGSLRDYLGAHRNPPDIV